MRKRSATVSATLEVGQTHTTTIWTHDHSSTFHAAGDVVVNLNVWPGLATGDVIQVSRAGSSVALGEGFMFLVSDETIAPPKSPVQHLSIFRELANRFHLSQNMDVVLTKIDPASATAGVVEVYFRDLYLGRKDMWLMISHLTGSPLFTGQKINFFSSQGAIVKKIYIDGRKVQSAVLGPSTRTVFRSLSARSNIFISVCRELWEFLEDGERYYEKIVHSFLPALIAKWRENTVKHVAAIVLFSRVYYDQSELEFAAGPLVKDADGNWYKDFYKVVVDLEILRDWRPVLVTLKQSFLEFQRDILFNHHYHQNSLRPEHAADHSTIQRLVGHLSYAQDAPILEAINLGLNPTDLHYVDRSLSLTGCSTIIITPGPGRFRCDKHLLQFTTMRLADQGFGVDLVCLTKAPLHVAPLFTYKSEDPDLLAKEARRDGFGGGTEGVPEFDSLEVDPLWSAHETNGRYPKKDYHWEPFWMQVTWWDVQADMPFRADRFVARAKMQEIQTIGLLNHDMVASIEIPYAEEVFRSQLETPSNVSREARRKAREEFDSSVFAAVPPASEYQEDDPEVASPTLNDVTPVNEPSSIVAHSVQPAPPPSPILPSSPALPRSGMPTVPPSPSTRVPAIGIGRQLARPSDMPRKPSEALLDAGNVTRPEVARGSSSSSASGPSQTQTAPGAASERLPRSRLRESSTSDALTVSSSSQRRSSSRDSARSTSTSSGRRAGGKSSGLTARFPGTSWLFGGLRTASTPTENQVNVVAGRRDETSNGSSEARGESPAGTSSTVANTSIERPFGMRASSTAASVLATIQRQSHAQSASSASIPASATPQPSSSEPIAIPQHSNSQRPPPELLDPDPTPEPTNAKYPQNSSAMVPHPNLARSRLSVSAFHILNPTRPLTISRTNAVLARCWQHVFHRPTFTSEIKWASMCAPACLPLTTEWCVSEENLARDYVEYTFDVHLTEAVKGSFLLRHLGSAASQGVMTGTDEEWARLVLREMIAARLVQGFQLVVRPSSSSSSKITSDTNPFIPTPAQAHDTLAKITPAAFPIGVSDVLPTTSHPVYLSIGSQLHRLQYEPIENAISVSRFVRRSTKRAVKTIPYACLVWPKLGEGYTEATTSFSLPDFDVYGWNRLDRTITGGQRDFGDLVRFWRTRYLVIPSEEPPLERYAEHGFQERLSDEECRLLGINRLSLLFHQCRWLAPGESKDTYTAPQFLFTTLDPSACVLDDRLMAQLDESNSTAVTGLHRIGDTDLEGKELKAIAEMMVREAEPGLIRDNQWHGNFYPDTFTGRQWVSWALRCFRDVASREEAEAKGAQLLKEGLFEHIRQDHGFMDGHYYYHLSPQYAPPRRKDRHRRDSGWLSSTSRSSSKDPSASRSDLSSSTSSLSAAPPNTAGLKPRKKHSLSQTMLIHADYRKRSTQAENVILQHDVIQNPGTAFHFELHWIGTAGRCIEDLLKYWSNIIAPYGLKLVEGYVDPIVDIPLRNIFQSCFPIPLALAPPPVPERVKKSLEAGSSTTWYFEYAILRKFGYILDIEAESSYASDAVDVFYSYRRASFEQSQFVHRSGRAFVQVMGGAEGFRWVTNRLLAASTATPVGVIGDERESQRESGEPTPHEKAAKLRLELLAFCSDKDKLGVFYEEVVRALPPVRRRGRAYESDYDDDDD